MSASLVRSPARPEASPLCGPPFCCSAFLMGFHLFAINLSLFIFIIVRFLCSFSRFCSLCRMSHVACMYLLLQSCLAEFSGTWQLCTWLCVCVYVCNKLLLSPRCSMSLSFWQDTHPHFLAPPCPIVLRCLVLDRPCKRFITFIIIEAYLPLYLAPDFCPAQP